MKKIRLFSLCLLVLLSTFLVACSANSTQAMAKDLDASVKNLLIAVSSLDWPEDDAIEYLSNIQDDKLTSNVVATDTQIDTSELYTWLENAHSKINVLLSTRGDLLLYLSEIYSGNVAFESADLLSINVYLNILKDNSTYLSSYNGMLKNQINQATTLFENQENVNLINAYLIKAIETLQVRCAKVDTSVLAMSSIIDIIKCNLVNDYYNYNEHKIEEAKELEINEEENKISDEDNNEQDDQNEQNQADDAVEDEIQQPNDDAENEESDDQNAIKFDSETRQVDNSNNENNQEENLKQNDKAAEIEVDLDEENNINNTDDELDTAEKDVNYDDQIMTLEEPIIGDTTNKSPNINENAKMQKSAKIDTKNTISQQKWDNCEEIDKEFTLNESEFEENSSVIREIIKENAI